VFPYTDNVKLIGNIGDIVFSSLLRIFTSFADFPQKSLSDVAVKVFILFFSSSVKSSASSTFFGFVP